MRNHWLCGVVVLLSVMCLRCPTEVVEDLGPIIRFTRLEHFSVNPTFLCENSSCVVHVSYVIISSEEQVSSELGVTGPDGVYIVLTREPQLILNNRLRFTAAYAGDDPSIWTAGPGLYVFSLLILSERVNDVGEVLIKREVVRFEDVHRIPHSAAARIRLSNQHVVTDSIQLGDIVVNAGKFDQSYQICSKGPVLLSVTYAMPLTITPSNENYPTELSMTVGSSNGDPLFTFDSVRPFETHEFTPPVILSEPITIETVADSGENPFPQETVRWILEFELGCRLE